MKRISTLRCSGMRITNYKKIFPIFLDALFCSVMKPFAPGKQIPALTFNGNTKTETSINIFPVNKILYP
jgi:hypothetical protein